MKKSSKICGGYFAAFWRGVKRNGNSYESESQVEERRQLLKDARIFLQLIGSLIYLTFTRPDIAYSVGVIPQFMQNPRTPHLDAAKSILPYIKGYNSYGLMYKKENDFLLKGFTDADWAGNADDRPSTSGYCFNFGRFCCSKRQPTIAFLKHRS